MAKVNPQVKMVNTHTYRFQTGDWFCAAGTTIQKA